MMVHLADSVHRGYSKIKIRTVDTDVVIAVALVSELAEDCEVWIALVLARTIGIFPFSV